jgi:hypothetical protein
MPDLSTLEMLAVLQDASERWVYDLMFRNAGWGLMWYCPERDPEYPTRKAAEEAAAKISTEEWMRVSQEHQGAFKKGLSVERYYPTFEKMIEAEYNQLMKERAAAVDTVSASN